MEWGTSLGLATHARASGQGSNLKGPGFERTGALLFCSVLSEFKSRRGSDRRSGGPLFAVQEAAATAQGTQRAIEIESRGDQRPQRGGIARHPAQHLAEVDI